MRRRRKIALPPIYPDEDFSYEVAGAWSALSPFKNETGIAVERWRMAVARGCSPVLTYYSIATWAAQARDSKHPKAPYHAVGFTEAVARSFNARIAEILRDVEREEERAYYADDRPVRVTKDGLKPIGGAIAEALARFRAVSVDSPTTEGSV